jgi:hypothetical protein
MNSSIINKFNFCPTISIFFVSFAFYCLSDVFSLLSIWLVGINLDNLQGSQIISSVLIAPVVETLLIFFPLMWVCGKFEFKSYSTILIVAFLFSLLHIWISVMHPFILFWPALMMCCNYYYFLSKNSHFTACVSTILIHSTFNLTSILCG